MMMIESNFWERLIDKILYLFLPRSFFARDYIEEEISVDNFKRHIVSSVVSEKLRSNKKWAKAVLLLPEESKIALEAMLKMNPELRSQINKWLEDLNDSQKQMVLFVDKKDNVVIHFLVSKETQKPSDMLSLVVFPTGENRIFN